VCDDLTSRARGNQNWGGVENTGAQQTLGAGRTLETIRWGENRLKNIPLKRKKKKKGKGLHPK